MIPLNKLLIKETKKLSELFDEWITSIDKFNNYIELCLIKNSELDLDKSNTMTYNEILEHGFDNGYFMGRGGNTIIEPYRHIQGYSEKNNKPFMIVNDFYENNFVRCSNEFIKGLQLKLIDSDDYKGLIITFNQWNEWLKKMNKKKFINEYSYINDFLGIYEHMTGETIKPETIKEHKKIKWIGTPSQFSYIFLELVNKGFIEQPTYRSETSPSRFAELCLNNFEIETTLESLKTEFKNNSSLGKVNRAKFTIPEKDWVTDRRSGTKRKKSKK